MPSLASYAPSIFAFLLACIVIRFPFLAVLIVAGSLIAFAAVYASIVTRLWKMQRDSRDTFSQTPGFKNVTVQMFQRGGTWIKSTDQLP